MRGRTPIPIELKRQQGDTRQRGARKFEESLKGAVEGPRGKVEPPAGLRKRAKEHFGDLVEALDAMSVLSTADIGTITIAAVAYDGMMAAQRGKDRNWKTVVDCMQRYNQAADRLGLSPSARARLPKVIPPEADDLEAALA